MASSRVRRGRESEQIVADYLASHGWPAARRIPASLPGRDILDTEGIAVEVKARRGLDLPAWLRQASKNVHDDHPLLVIRPDGFGPASVHLWAATMPFECAVELLHEAGHGRWESEPDSDT